MSSVTAAEVLLGFIALVFTDLRWLRVAQREHYLTGAVSVFVRRWWYGMPKNAALWGVGLLAFILAPVFPAAVIVTAIALAIGPLGLSPKGRTSPLAWTRRLKTLAVATLALQGIVVCIGAILGAFAFTIAAVVLFAPTFVELGLVVTRPWENKIANGFIAEATKRLDQVAPLVVGITGSYGKTTTKNALEHLLEGTRTVFASPASFNNRNGLSRAINEQLTPGTDVFIAEMGTYGFGEIAELCEFCPPTISVFTAVGPVHLERFGSEAAIIAAKSEIFETAQVCVLNIDDDRLDHLANALEEDGKAVWRCGTKRETARVLAPTTDNVTSITVDGSVIAKIQDATIAPSNIACAVAVALELEVPVDDIAERLQTLPSVANRREVAVNAKGVTVINDTYNLNPAGVERGLAALAATAGTRRIVVTPGMVELGHKQSSANTAFAQASAESATHLIIIGSTNRKALLEGAKGTSLETMTVGRLSDAVAWVREHAESGDAVLYANDLPDHHP